MLPADDVRLHIAVLEAAVVDLHAMARRYADGRRSYATGMLNDSTRALLGLGFEHQLDDTDDTVFARHGDGYRSGVPIGFDLPTIEEIPYGGRRGPAGGRVPLRCELAPPGAPLPSLAPVRRPGRRPSGSTAEAWARYEALRRVANDCWWMARRYATRQDGGAPACVNHWVRALLAMGLPLSLSDDVVFALHPAGRAHDGLTAAEALPFYLGLASHDFLSGDNTALMREAEARAARGVPWVGTEPFPDLAALRAMAH